MTRDASRPLDPGAVHLWLCEREAAAGLDLSVLNEQEKARAARWRGDGPADFALGRGFLRHLLSTYGTAAPQDWEFENGPHGKPALLAGEPAMQFNLSHSGRWLALAVSARAAVGVDVQVFDHERPLERLARRYFSEPERGTLEELEGEDFNRHFFRLWALKEAWTKARGEALPGALATTAFEFSGGELVSLTPALLALVGCGHDDALRTAYTGRDRGPVNPPAESRKVVN